MVVREEQPAPLLEQPRQQICLLVDQLLRVSISQAAQLFQQENYIHYLMFDIHPIFIGMMKEV